MVESKMKEVANILGIERSILDEAEKKYLENVIRPFKNRVVSITKRRYGYHDLKGDYITIRVQELGRDDYSNDIILPYFYSNAMYKGMELSREYTLEELGLFQD